MTAIHRNNLVCGTDHVTRCLLHLGDARRAFDRLLEVRPMAAELEARSRGDVRLLRTCADFESTFARTASALGLTDAHDASVLKATQLRARIRELSGEG